MSVCVCVFVYVFVCMFVHDLFCVWCVVVVIWRRGQIVSNYL